MTLMGPLEAFFLELRFRLLEVFFATTSNFGIGQRVETLDYECVNFSIKYSLFQQKSQVPLWRHPA